MGLVFTTKPNPNRDTEKRSLDIAFKADAPDNSELIQLRVDLDDLRRQFYAFVSASNISDERGSY
jgi:hypothetical protein